MHAWEECRASCVLGLQGLLLMRWQISEIRKSRFHWIPFVGFAYNGVDSADVLWKQFQPTSFSILKDELI